MNQLTKNNKKMIMKNILLLNKNHQKHIFSLIYENNIKFTENKSGCYIKFSDIPNNLLIKIFEYINLHLKIGVDIKYKPLPQTIDSNENNSEIDKLNLTNYEKTILKKDLNIN